MPHPILGAALPLLAPPLSAGALALAQDQQRTWSWRIHISKPTGLSPGHLLRVLPGWSPSHRPLEWASNLCEQHPRFPLRALNIVDYPSSLKGSQLEWGWGVPWRKLRPQRSTGWCQALGLGDIYSPALQVCLILYSVSRAILQSHVWLTRGLTGPTTSKRLLSVLTPGLPGTPRGSRVDCTAVLVSAWHSSWTVTCPAAFSVHVCTCGIHIHETHEWAYHLGTTPFETALG